MMTPTIIAILRGIPPTEASAVAGVLIDSGVPMIEVLLNAPDAMDSLQAVVHDHGTRAQIGAGMVTTPQEVRAAAKLGARLIASPHVDQTIIAAARDHDIASHAGIITPTEAFAALRAGVHALKLYPAFQTGPRGLSALRSMLSPDIAIYPAGGLGPADFTDWIAAGASGFGVGAALYRPGDRPETVRLRARILVAALENPI